jgi:hypothetical protein
VVDQEVDIVVAVARAAAEAIIKATTTIGIATVIKHSFFVFYILSFSLSAMP